MWAYPDGIKVYDHRLNIINDNQPEESFGKEHWIKVCIEANTRDKPMDFSYSFVHTDYSLNRIYFSSLCWHEAIYIPLKTQKRKDSSSSKKFKNVAIFSLSFPNALLENYRVPLL